MAKKHALMYYTYLDDLAGYSDAEFGRLMRAVLRYARDGEEVPLKKRELLVWPILRCNVERANEHYEEISRKRSESARRRYENSLRGL